MSMMPISKPIKKPSHKSNRNLFNLSKKIEIPAPTKKPPLEKINKNNDIIDMDFLKKTIRKHESKTNYMYKDTADGGGKVTVGIGLMLPNAESAIKLPFTVPDGNGGRRLATDKEKGVAFHSVSKINNKKGYKASSFDPISGKIAKDYGLKNMSLPDEIIDKLLEKRLENDILSVKRKIKNFDKLPNQAKRALIDLEYNQGPTKFVRSRKINGIEEGWPNLFESLDEMNGSNAAKESKRKGVSEERNNETHNGFLSIDRIK